MEKKSKDGAEVMSTTKTETACIFGKGFVTHVPTWALIEDVQALRRALTCTTSVEDLHEQVYITIECLEDLIARHTEAPDYAKFMPSGSTLIAPSIQDGILMQSNGEDIPCRAGRPISEAMSGGVSQCTEACPHYQDCFHLNGEPWYGRILPMPADYQDDATDEKLMEYLEGQFPQSHRKEE